MKQYLYNGKVVTASSKKEVVAFNVDRIDSSTKELYELMNKGDFLYAYRVDDDFDSFVNNTLEEEIQSVIRSSRQLIRGCIEKRRSSASIVWDALYSVFKYVINRNKLKVKLSFDKMKNWFAYNKTDYKTALKKIIENMNDFREELRETEVTAAIPTKDKDIKNNLEILIANCKSFISCVDFVSKIIKMHQWNVTEFGRNFNENETWISWTLTNKQRKSATFKVILSRGLKSTVMFDSSIRANINSATSLVELMDRFVG